MSCYRSIVYSSKEKLSSLKGVYELKSGSLEINGEVITSISYYPEFEGGLKGVKLNDFEATKSMGAVFWECSGETLDFEIDNDFIMTVSKKDSIGYKESAQFGKVE